MAEQEARRAALDAKVKASQKHYAEALEFHSRQASRPARTSVGMAGAKTALLLAPRAHAAGLPMPHAAAETNTSADEANPWSQELAGVRSAWRAAASGIASNFTLKQQERAAAKEQVVRAAAAAESVRLLRLQAEADLERARTVTQMAAATANHNQKLAFAAHANLTRLVNASAEQVIGVDLGEQAAAAVAAAAQANQEVDEARARLKNLSASGSEPAATRRLGGEKSDFKAASYLVSQRATVAESAKRKALAALQRVNDKLRKETTALATVDVAAP